MDSKVNVLDGSKDEQDKIFKSFLGLSSEQSYQDIKIEDED